MYNFIISSLIEAGISLVICVGVLAALGMWYYMMYLIWNISAGYYWPKKHPLLWLILCGIPAIGLSIIVIYVIDFRSHGITTYEWSPFAEYALFPITEVALCVVGIVVIGEGVRNVIADIKKKKQASQSPT